MFQQVVTMLCVGRAVRSGILQLPARLSVLGTFSGVGFPSGLRRLSGLGSPSGVEMFSGVRRLSDLGSPAGVRRLSGGAAGWYSSLSDSAPVHLCERFLVSVQQVSGLPWWLAIIVATLSVRTLITLPLATYQMVIIAKVSDNMREGKD